MYGLSLFDVVRAPINDEKYEIQDVVEKSGHRTLRALIQSEHDADRLRRGLIKDVNDLGGSPEFYSSNFLSVDAPDEDCFERVRDLLSRLETLGRLELEIGDSPEEIGKAE